MRILIVDDHTLFRRGVRELLLEHGLQTIDEAATGNDAIELAHQTRYDAIMLDVSLPDRDGLDVLKQIKAERPAVPILMVSMHAEDQYALRSLKAGASGYVTKDANAGVLWSAFAKIVAGGRFVTPELAERLAGDLTQHGAGESHEKLTDREFQVFRSIAAGVPARETAAQLGLSVKTVNTHRMNILAKLGCRSNAELIRYAVDRRIV